MKSILAFAAAALLSLTLISGLSRSAEPNDAAMPLRNAQLFSSACGQRSGSSAAS